ncbi:MAG: protein-disulfide reductase DsbD domain-containing protein, partial [Chthoniobacterales bacterium]
MKPVLRIVCRLAIALSIFGIASRAHAQVYQGKQLVRAELVADTNAIVPGKTFTLGLLLRMAPGWHTYWKFPGDSGLPTEVNWKLPPGWKQIGALQWPIPLKTNDPGDIQTYGYEDEVLLMQEIQAASGAQSEKVTISAEANWLVCERICIPGGATLQIDLPVATSSVPATEELFARYRRLLPQNWPDDKIAKASWTRTDSDLRLTVTSATLPKYAAIDFYPLPPQDAVIGHPRIEARSENDVTFRVPVESPKDLSSMGGLVVFADRANGSDRSAWQLQPPGSSRSTANLHAPRLGISLLFGFIGGFILNLMPCVLPVISLKIFGFIQQAG